MRAPDFFLENLYQKTVSKLPVEYDESWKWNGIELFCQLIGHFPTTKEEELNSKVIEKTEKEEYSRIRVEITTLDNLIMPTYILIPKKNTNSKFPAVLALHGHGFGSKEIVGLNVDGTENDYDPGIHQNCAIELVKKGMVVVAPELIGFGDRKLVRDTHSDNQNQNSCFAIASQLLLMGKTLAGLRVFECRKVLDFIETINEVDPDRIGCFGFSGGGLVAAFTSIVDQRIKATVLSGYTNTFKGSIMERNHCLDNYIPGVLQLGEMPELIGLIAPRPLFIESGMGDPLFPVKHVKEAFEVLTHIYEKFNAVNSLNYHLFEGEHEICGEKSYEWLYHTLLFAKNST
ncbi:MAG TPA: alpha/beta hydrolase family protein [Metabacillus sp.]|nr:alpha/beta hydrolase family protein [Metabacillus sp.]